MQIIATEPFELLMPRRAGQRSRSLDRFFSLLLALAISENPYGYAVVMDPRRRN